MVNLFAWASIGENGRAVGGKPGDQTGKEVRVAPYYYFGQNKCIRLRNPTRQKKVAEIAKFLALSNVIGYDQCTRTTLHEVCESYIWNWNLIKQAIIINQSLSEPSVSKIVSVNTDDKEFKEFVNAVTKKF